MAMLNFDYRSQTGNRLCLINEKTCFKKDLVNLHLVYQNFEFWHLHPEFMTKCEKNIESFNKNMNPLFFLNV